jgi:hypothetical protein
MKRGSSSCTFSRQPPVGNVPGGSSSQTSTPSQHSPNFRDLQLLTVPPSDSEDTGSPELYRSARFENQQSSSELIFQSLLPPLEQPDQLSIEFELILRHPIAFPALVPLDTPLSHSGTFLNPRGSRSVIARSCWNSATRFFADNEKNVVLVHTEIWVLFQPT